MNCVFTQSGLIYESFVKVSVSHILFFLLMVSNTPVLIVRGKAYRML